MYLDKCCVASVGYRRQLRNGVLKGLLVVRVHQVYHVSPFARLSTESTNMTSECRVSDQEPGYIIHGYSVKSTLVS